jgi:peptidoglycan/LPS O-acetylase OafA/YrhL
VNVRADRFFLLDSLRGVGALMVLTTHTAWVSGGLLPEAAIRPYQARIEAAFAMFFLISGFLLYRPFVRAHVLGRPRLSVKAYGWRRFLRIVPVFWVALVVTGLWLGKDMWNARELVRNFFFLQLYYGGGENDVIPQGWTLCVEVTFYSLLPVWAALMRRVPGRTINDRLRSEFLAVGGLILASIAYTATLTYSHAVDPIPFWPTAALSSLPGYMDHIGLGMLLAVVSVWVQERRSGDIPQPFALLARFPSIAWLIAVFAIWFGATQLGLTGASGEKYTPTQYMARHLLNSLFSVAVVIPAIFGDMRHGATRRVLAFPPLVWLGLISYSFYLYHWAVLQQLYHWDLGTHFQLVPAFPRFYLPALIAGAAIGAVSYYLVERPAMSLKRLVPPLPRQSRDEALAEPAPATPVTAPRAG